MEEPEDVGDKSQLEEAWKPSLMSGGQHYRCLQALRKV